MNKKLFIAGIFVLSTFFLFSFAQAQYNYQPLEEIPGFGKIADFPGFILAVYKFGIWTVAIAALLMITIGGFMYLTSAGNMSKNDTAKGIIQDALIGLIIAMVAYLILFVINPDLVKIKLDMQTTSPGTGSSAPAAGTTSPTTGKNCKDGKCSQVDDAIASNSYGVDPAILKSLIVGGEGCNNNHSSDGKSCGYGQVNYKYMRSVCGMSGSDQELCSKMKSDTKLDINCTAKFVKEQTIPCAKKKFGNTEMKSIGSCYNAGYTGKCGTDNYCERTQNYFNSCK